MRSFGTWARASGQSLRTWERSSGSCLRGPVRWTSKDTYCQSGFTSKKDGIINNNKKWSEIFKNNEESYGELRNNTEVPRAGENMGETYCKGRSL